jgi:hypothetical protein
MCNFYAYKMEFLNLKYSFFAQWTLPHEAALPPPPFRHGTYTLTMGGIQTRDRRRYPTCSLLSLCDNAAFEMHTSARSVLAAPHLVTKEAIRRN